MNIKKEYEKFFSRKRNDLCVHDAEDVITFAKHCHNLQLQQTGVIRSSGNYCKSCNSKNISIDVSCEPNELICDDCWSLDISTENES